MSEVKFDVRRYKVPAMIGVSGDIIKHSPPVAMVHASSFDAVAGELDAQRLRADTAEAELALTEKEVAGLQEALGDAEQRAADISVILSRIIEVQKTDYSIRGGLPHRWECLIAQAKAALNRNPEAESHE